MPPCVPIDGKNNQNVDLKSISKQAQEHWLTTAYSGESQVTEENTEETIPQTILV